MIALLDVNVLIALVDTTNPHHASSMAFFASAQRGGWATCPLTENGFLRIVGRSSYVGGPGSTQDARKLLAKYLVAPGHHFWPDDLSFNDERQFPDLPASADLTDIYLLALAVKNGGRFATFDSKIDPSIIPSGPQAYHLIRPS